MKKESFSISGYPVSQLIIAGVISLVSVGLYLLIKHLGGPPSPEPFLEYSLYGMLGIAFLSVLKQPSMSLYEDHQGQLVVKSTWMLGAFQKARRVPLEDIQRLTFWIRGSQTNSRGSADSIRISASSRFNLYAELSNGDKFYFFPMNKAVPGLSKRFANAIARQYGIPFSINGVEQPHN